MPISDTLQIWQRLFNASPQAYNQLPGGNGSQASGTIGEFTIVVTAQLGRTELAIHPGASPALGLPMVMNPGPFLPLITNVDAALAALAGYARTLVTTGDLIRLAILLNLSKRVASLAESIQEFQRNTNIKTGDGATDLNFSYNFPTRTKEGLEINRVRRWTTGAQQFVTMQMLQANAGPLLTPSPSPIVHTIHAALLQIDVNTAPQRAAMASAHAQSVLDQLVSEATNLMSGDHDPSYSST